MSTLKEDLIAYCATLRDWEIPSEEGFSATGLPVRFVAEEHLDDMRWGSIKLRVWEREGEYIGFTYYDYSGDSDGEAEVEVVDVDLRITETWVVKP